MDKREKEIRRMRITQNIFFVVLLIIAALLGLTLWYLASDPDRHQNINNINYISEKKGEPGLSAYQLALKNGFVGTELEWLSSLQGRNGITKVIHENTQTIIEIPATPAKDGASAYDLWLAAGNAGTVEDFLRSLISPPTADRVTEVRFNQISGKYETRLTGDLIWKTVSECGLIKVCK